MTEQTEKPIYLDCNATAPIEPEIRDVVLRFMMEEFGNAGSRTHQYGSNAKQAVQRAREQVARAVGANADEIVFTSGATESNNLAILGLAPYGNRSGRKHIISTLIEHKAVLEPLERLSQDGFEVTLVPPTQGGWVEASTILKELREDTLLVSMMHVNNETGVVQPLSDISAGLADHPAYFHVDAAQGFGKQPAVLRDKRIDLISVSGHKVYGPKGVGALVVRRRNFDRTPLTPLFFGGGQERGLRPGTLPVPLIVGLGLASELAIDRLQERQTACLDFRRKVLDGLASISPVFNGDPERTLSHVINISFPGIDSEALMVALKNNIAISNGSACTSQSYKPSHVLKAMGLSEARVKGAVRISWCHMTPEVEWDKVAALIKALC